MRKTMKKLLATAFAGALALTGTVGLKAPVQAQAAEESTESYEVFVAFGGDVAEENDWGYNYAGGDSADGITATTGTIAVGETVTVGLEFDSPVVNTWYVAPTIIADSVVDADFDVQVLIDGQEVAADLSAGDNWWYEATGDYDDTQAIRVAGGYNEWGTQYIEEPANFSKIEFVITANSIQVGEAEVGEVTESTETYDMFLAFGGDAVEENDWALSYDGTTATDGVTNENATIAVGETATVTLTFAEPVVNAWYFAPTIIAENVVEADFTVEAYVDGEQVDVDMSAGDNWWYEATGEYDETQAVRIAGGFNEWGAQYIAEPSGFTELKYVITANSIKVGTGVASDSDAETVSAAGEVDLDGVYHAYIGFQTPKYSFRNSWHGEDGYGHDTAEFEQVTGWDAEGNAITMDGTFTDAEITGNGTYTVSVSGLNFDASEFESQEYMNLIFFSTDIPNTGAITISDVSLKVDGNTVSGVNAIVNPESVNYMDVQVQSTYNEDIAEIGFYNTPMSEMSITFTVSGFNYDNENIAEAEEPADDTEATDTADTTESDDDSSNIVPIIIIICVVVVIIIVVAVVLAKKKKK